MDATRNENKRDRGMEILCRADVEMCAMVRCMKVVAMATCRREIARLCRCSRHRKKERRGKDAANRNAAWFYRFLPTPDNRPVLSCKMKTTRHRVREAAVKYFFASSQYQRTPLSMDFKISFDTVCSFVSFPSLLSSFSFDFQKKIS